MEYIEFKKFKKGRKEKMNIYKIGDIYDGDFKNDKRKKEEKEK